MTAYVSHAMLSFGSSHAFASAASIYFPAPVSQAMVSAAQLLYETLPPSGDKSVVLTGVTFGMTCGAFTPFVGTNVVTLPSLTMVIGNTEMTEETIAPEEATEGQVTSPEESQVDSPSGATLSETDILMQQSRPVSDGSLTGDWQAHTVPEKWKAISKGLPDAGVGGYIASSDNPQGDTYEALLSALAPAPDGPVIISYQLGQAGGSGSVSCTVELYCGGATCIATWEHSVLPLQPTQYSWHLTPEQIAAITDWSNLRLRFTGNTNANMRAYLSWAKLTLYTPPRRGFLSWAKLSLQIAV